MFKSRAPSAWLTRALRVLTPTDAPQRCDKENGMTLWRRLRLPYAAGNVACARHLKAAETFTFPYAGLTPAYAARGKINKLHVGTYATRLTRSLRRSTCRLREAALDLSLSA